MPSSYTSRNRVEKQGPGENLGTWGQLLNTRTIDMIDQSLDGVASFSLSGPKTLTANNALPDEARCRFLNITGGSGGTLTIPNVEKMYVVRNSSAGAVTLTTGSGVTCNVAPGAFGIVLSDGANVVRNALASVASTASAADITAGTLTVSRGGTGTTTSTGSGSVVLNTTPVFAGGAVAISGGPNAGLSLGRDTNVSNYSHIDFAASQGSLGLKLRSDSGAEVFTVTTTDTSFVTTTTASAANLHQVGTNNPILRSTSSLRYKSDVENADPQFARKLLDLRPVWYRSKSQNDNPAHGFFGFIAEEAHELGLPQLVHYAYQEDQFEEFEMPVAVSADPSDSEERCEAAAAHATSRGVQRLKAGEERRPDGIQYERVTVLQQVLINQLFERLEAIDAKIAELAA